MNIGCSAISCHPSSSWIKFWNISGINELRVPRHKGPSINEATLRGGKGGSWNWASLWQRGQNKKETLKLCMVNHWYLAIIDCRFHVIIVIIIIIINNYNYLLQNLLLFAFLFMSRISLHLIPIATLNL